MLTTPESFLGMQCVNLLDLMHNPLPVNIFGPVMTDSLSRLSIESAHG